jgi:protein TonB
MSITGNLKTLEFAELLQWLAQGQKTGALVIQNGHTEKRIYFSEGKIISSESNNPEEHLGSFMVREGLIDEATLARAVKLQESTQILLGKVLVTLGTITEEELHHILRKKTEESLYKLFAWTEGDFRFVPDDLPRLPMVPLEIDVTNVVLEGAKRFDEARRDAQLGTGEYGTQIDEVLSSEIFQGIEISDSGPVLEDLPSGKHEALSLPATPAASEEERPSTEIRGYYSGRRPKATKMPMVAATAALAAIGIGVLAYFIMRPEPAADAASLAIVPPIERAESVNDSELFRGLEPAAEGNDVVPASAEPEPPRGANAAAPRNDRLQARYEAELAALKKQLEQAQVAAAERDDAMDRLAELEEQVAQTREEPPLQYGSGQNGEPSLSAGGDEAPPLGSPLPTTAADREAGTDFATEMVESTPDPILPEAAAPPPSTQVPVEEASMIEQAQTQITPPTLLTRPKPRYPVAAMRLRKEAVVTLRLLIDPNGKVIDVERVGPEAGMGFDRAAVTAALATRWQPATEDGEPIEMWTEMRIAFKP